jgi:dolichol-phosphate mannosyltransferase
MSNENSYSVILPTLNEVGHINSLIIDISNIFNKFNIEYEIIIVDDNSQDGTVEEILKIKNSHINIYSRKGKKKNLVDSLNEGIMISNKKNIIWMDADYSHPPDYIEKFIEINSKDIDLIVCSRFLKKSTRYYEALNKKKTGIDFLSNFLNKVCKIFLFTEFTDYTSGFICIKKEIIKNFKLKGYYGDYFINLITNCIISGCNILEIPFEEKERATGNSKTTAGKLNFLIKCYFYFTTLNKSIFQKIFKFSSLQKKKKNFF